MSPAVSRVCVVTPWRDSRPFYPPQAESGEICVTCRKAIKGMLPARTQLRTQGLGFIDDVARVGQNPPHLKCIRSGMHSD